MFNFFKLPVMLASLVTRQLIALLISLNILFIFLPLNDQTKPSLLYKYIIKSLGTTINTSGLPIHLIMPSGIEAFCLKSLWFWGLEFPRHIIVSFFHLRLGHELLPNHSYLFSLNSFPMCTLHSNEVLYDLHHIIFDCLILSSLLLNFLSHLYF